MIDRANEYADKTVARVILANGDTLTGPLTFALELAAAFRAGEAEGYAAANRKEVSNEGSLNAARELT